MVADSESGTIEVPDKTIRRLLGALREATNTFHGAVLFEIDVLSKGLGSTGADLVLLAERALIAREQWSGRDAPDQKMMINMLAVRALEEHVAACRSTRGRLRAIGPRVLDELLPKRSGRDVYFRIPDRNGDVPAGITLDDGELRWHAEATEHATARAARSAPIADVAFGILARTTFPPGMGGEIRDGDGRVTATFS